MHITTLKVTIALVMGLSQNNYAHSNVIHAHMEAAMVDITREEAEQLVADELNKKGDNDLVVDKSKTTKYQFGWVVEIFPKIYIDKGIHNIDQSIVDLGILGIGFYIVTQNGEIQHIPSNISPDRAIDWFTKNWKPNHNNDQLK